MNLIDPIRHYLSRVNPDINSWVVKVNGKSSRIRDLRILACNRMSYRKRTIDFHLVFKVNLETCDISFFKVVFKQNGKFGVNNTITRNRLAFEMMENINNKGLPNELERAVNIILSVSNEMKERG